MGASGETGGNKFVNMYGHLLLILATALRAGLVRLGCAAFDVLT